jgi:hypothetical protein
MKFKRTKGRPMTVRTANEEIQCIFHEEDQNTLTVLLVKNDFSKSEKRKFNKNEIKTL